MNVTFDETHPTLINHIKMSDHVKVPDDRLEALKALAEQHRKEAEAEGWPAVHNAKKFEKPVILNNYHHSEKDPKELHIFLFGIFVPKRNMCKAIENFTFLPAMSQIVFMRIIRPIY